LELAEVLQHQHNCGGQQFPGAALGGPIRRFQPSHTGHGSCLQRLYRGGQLAPGGEAPGTPPIDYYWFYRAIDRALQGKNLEQELAQAQALTEQYVACVRSGGERQPCDQQVDPNYGQE
jgi:hypothetical protein